MLSNDIFTLFIQKTAMLLPLKESENQTVVFNTTKGNKLDLTIKREDLLHKHISGNKYRKLRYNLEEAYRLGLNTIVTFGGAYSNHISATAAAANELGFKSIGIIRGDELAGSKETIDYNPTLSLAAAQGMQFEFISRSLYREKETTEFLKQLKEKYGNVYIIPQGGTNKLAVKGCTEILTESDTEFDLITCAIGTGGTISGIINSAFSHQKVWGFPALKDDFLENEIKKYTFGQSNWELIKTYHFGGFAKINAELVNFINDFKTQTGVSLDPIYTGKMIYGLADLLDKGILNKNQKILTIHTGGLQGISGMNQKLKHKKQPLLI